MSKGKFTIVGLFRMNNKNIQMISVKPEYCLAVSMRALGVERRDPGCALRRRAQGARAAVPPPDVFC
jgi:hypothetical protein